jgi:hypothetical protein
MLLFGRAHSRTSSRRIIRGKLTRVPQHFIRPDALKRAG